MINTFEVTEEFVGDRLDLFLSKKLDSFSRSQIQEMIKDGKVKCNTNITTLPRFAVKENMTVYIETPDEVKVEALQEEPFNFEILFEDDSILVINKPVDVVVHPGAGNQTGTIVNALMGRYPAWKELYAEEKDSAWHNRICDFLFRLSHCPSNRNNYPRNPFHRYRNQFRSNIRTYRRSYHRSHYRTYNCSYC